MTVTLAVFLFFGVLAVVSAGLVVVQKNAMHSVLYLAFTVLAVAGVFFCLQAEYLGAIQIVVYGGGIVVLYVFVIVIVNLKEVVPERRKLVPRIVIAGTPEEFKPNTVSHIQKGRFYISRLDDGGVLALWQRCTHLGCTVPWVEDAGEFHCPCHSSVFDRKGVVLDGPAPRPLSIFPVSLKDGKLVVDGNDMCAAAALFSGCEFFGGYQITPSSEIMHFFGREVWKYGGTMMQAEDEIAGIGAVVGASFAGKKAMTATSGPGMSLKTEMLGLASIAELPLVCVNVQRGGPSTGIPTKSEQSDLFQACFSAHGDVVRPVLAPTSVADTFSLTVEAFNIAEQYQTPVILLSDQEIAQRKETVDPIDTAQFRVIDRRRPTAADLEKYERFKLTESGISPISHPGMPGGNYLASGIEHNERGAPTASGALHARMNEKRIRKLDPLKRRRDLFQGLAGFSLPGVAIQTVL